MSAEKITVSEMTTKLDGCDTHDEVIDMFTKYLKGLSPHHVTCDSLVDLGRVIDNHLDSMNYIEIDSEQDMVQDVIEAMMDI